MHITDALKESPFLARFLECFHKFGFIVRNRGLSPVPTECHSPTTFNSQYTLSLPRLQKKEQELPSLFHFLHAYFLRQTLPRILAESMAKSQQSGFDPSIPRRRAADAAVLNMLLKKLSLVFVSTK